MEKSKSKNGKHFAIDGKHFAKVGNKFERFRQTSFSSLFKQQIEMSFIQFLDDAFREFNELTGRENVKDEVMYYESQIEEPKMSQHKRNVENHSISQRLTIAKIKAEQALLNLQIAVIEAEQQEAPPNVAVGIPAVVEIPSLTSVTATIAPDINLVTDSDSDDDMPISQMMVARPKTKTTYFPPSVWNVIKSYSLPPKPIKIKKGDTLCMNFLDYNRGDDGWVRARILLVISVSKKSIKYLDYYDTEDNDFDIRRSGYNDPNSGFREYFHERDDENFKSTKLRVERNCIRYGGTPITTDFINPRQWVGSYFPYEMGVEEKARMFRWMEFKQSKRKWQIISKLQ